jgi:hypothetical protein
LFLYTCHGEDRDFSHGKDRCSSGSFIEHAFLEQM